jgi:REP element-mobilizing transposase RayT
MRVKDSTSKVNHVPQLHQILPKRTGILRWQASLPALGCMENQIYFITGCCRDYFPALELEQAKQVIWERLEHYCNEFEFFLWLASVMSNHDHLIGYSRSGANLKKILQRFHGSTIKLINDLLPERRTNF